MPITMTRDSEEPEAIETTVDVDVVGRRYPFLLDTGAGGTRVPADAHTASFVRVGPDVAGGRGALGPGRTDPRVVVPELSVAGIVVRDLVCDLAPGGDEESGPPAILGLDVLRRHRLDLRFSQSTLTIDDPAASGPTHELLLSSRGHPYVRVAWGEVQATAIWDTGAGMTVVDRALADAHPDVFARQGAVSGTDAYGHTHELEKVLMAPCRIGSRGFAASAAAVAGIAGIHRPGDPPFELILGMPVLAQADWRIDLVRGLWAYL